MTDDNIYSPDYKNTCFFSGYIKNIRLSTFRDGRECQRFTLTIEGTKYEIECYTVNQEDCFRLNHTREGAYISVACRLRQRDWTAKSGYEGRDTLFECTWIGGGASLHGATQ